MTTHNNDGDNDDNSAYCFPVLEMFRRLASAGSLAMKLEKNHMMGLMVQSSSSADDGELRENNKTDDDSNWNISNNHPLFNPLGTDDTKEAETEIVFSGENDDNDQSGKESDGEDNDDDDDETLDTISSVGSSSSPASSEAHHPPSETSLLSQEQQAAEQTTPTTQQQQVKPKAPSIMKKRQRPPSVFGLDVVMESEDELDEEEEEDSKPLHHHQEEDGSSVVFPIHKSSTAIRWSDDENNSDPNAVNVTVHEVECIKDRTDMWWQGSEFVTIKQSVSETIRFCKAYNRNQVELLEDIMRCDCLEDEDLMKDLLQDLLSTTCDSSSLRSSSSSSESFTRGLEAHLSKLINKHRKRHTRKVLSAQEKLLKTITDKNNYYSEETCERLREESLDKSQLLSAFARRMGQFDEMVVAKSLKARRSLWDI